MTPATITVPVRTAGDLIAVSDAFTEAHNNMEAGMTFDAAIEKLEADLKEGDELAAKIKPWEWV